MPPLWLLTFIFVVSPVGVMLPLSLPPSAFNAPFLPSLCLSPLPSPHPKPRERQRGVTTVVSYANYLRRQKEQLAS
ncbi:hypothetical protein E2C01_098815 [Portunus trituberculatus]|uniref:Secreted protein n=1 Tax=Portunus trituberculatus TaxID=210409 RepID=A0A5B7K7X5_PORTR|nr:hypothetical protein [Portunus trituberculatus]